MPTYQLKLTLKGSDPVIWRRILTSSDLLLSSFHQVIQTVMAWEDCHLYGFFHKGEQYDPDSEIVSEAKKAKVSIGTLLKAPKDKMNYMYDYGDSWKIDIVLEKILPDNEVKSPVYMDGKMAAPPEDCGGLYGYYSMLQILNDPKHPEHEETLEWIGDFDPNHIDNEYIMKCFSKTKYQYLKQKTERKPRGYWVKD